MILLYEKELAILQNINAFPVQRNNGIDGFLKDYKMKVLIQTRETEISRLFDFESDVTIIKSLELQTKDLMKKINEGIIQVLQNGRLSVLKTV